MARMCQCGHPIFVHEGTLLGTEFVEPFVCKNPWCDCENFVEVCDHGVPTTRRCRECDLLEYGDMMYDEGRIRGA